MQNYTYCSNETMMLIWQSEFWLRASAIRQLQSHDENREIARRIREVCESGAAAKESRCEVALSRRSGDWLAAKLTVDIDASRNGIPARARPAGNWSMSGEPPDIMLDGYGSKICAIG